MNPGYERPGLPPRSHSLNTGVTAAAPLAVALDFQGDTNEEKKLSDDLVAEAKVALQYVDDGGRPKGLYPVVEELVDRVQQLVRPQLEEIKSAIWLRLLLICTTRLCILPADRYVGATTGETSRAGNIITGDEVKFDTGACQHRNAGGSPTKGR
jgi:hypothetical protein